MTSSNSPSKLRKAVKAVAVFEALKGLAAFAGMLGLLSLLHHDMHQLALALIGQFGFSPDGRYPTALLNAVDRLNATPVHSVVLLGSAYIAVRWIEAWGLWHDTAWGEWFGALSSAIYVPFEVRHVMAHPHWQGATVLIFNIALILILLWRIYQRRQSNLTRGSTQT